MRKLITLFTVVIVIGATSLFMLEYCSNTNSNTFKDVSFRMITHSI